MRSVLRKTVGVLAAIGGTMGYKYETPKDRFSFLPRRNLDGFSRRSSAEELQNRAAAENRRGGGNRDKRRLSRIGRSEMPPYGQPLCNNLAADDPEKRPRSPTPITQTSY